MGAVRLCIEKFVAVLIDCAAIDFENAFLNYTYRCMTSSQVTNAVAVEYRAVHAMRISLCSALRTCLLLNKPKNLKWQIHYIFQSEVLS